jgi:hypothetical protein
MPAQVAGRVGKHEEAAMNGTKNTTMNRTQAVAALALAIAASVLAISAAAASGFMGDGRNKGGYVKPCSLDGVNPVHHPDIFGNPALARAYYGFVRGRDGTWQVQDNCHIY